MLAQIQRQDSIFVWPWIHPRSSRAIDPPGSLCQLRTEIQFKTQDSVQLRRSRTNHKIWKRRYCWLCVTAQVGVALEMLPCYFSRCAPELFLAIYICTDFSFATFPWHLSSLFVVIPNHVCVAELRAEGVKLKAALFCFRATYIIALLYWCAGFMYFINITLAFVYIIDAVHIYNNIAAYQCCMWPILSS